MSAPGNFRINRQRHIEQLLRQTARGTDFTVREATTVPVHLDRTWPFSNYKSYASVPFAGGRRLTSTGLLIEPAYSRVIDRDGIEHFNATGYFILAFGVHGQPLDRTLQEVEEVLLHVVYS